MVSARPSETSGVAALGSGGDGGSAGHGDDDGAVVITHFVLVVVTVVDAGSAGVTAALASAAARIAWMRRVSSFWRSGATKVYSPVISGAMRPAILRRIEGAAADLLAPTDIRAD